MNPTDIANMVTTLGAKAFPGALARFLRSTAEINSIAIAAYGQGQPPALLYDDCPPDEHLRVVGSYLSGAYKLDPFYLSCIAGVEMGLYRLKTLAPDHFSRSEYYRTYYKQIGIVDELGYVVRLPSGLNVVVSLGRYQNEKEFSKSVFDDFIQVEPIVRSVVARNWGSFTFQQTAAGDKSVDILASLTQREHEVALMILKGYSSEAIALNLAISRLTVKVHRRNAYAKLKISSSTELFHLYMARATSRNQFQTA